MDAPSTSLSDLPSYQKLYNRPSSPPPTFSTRLYPGEERVEFTPSPRALITPTGTFRKQCKRFSISVFDQEPDVEAPMFDRNSLINGVLAFQSAEASASVLKVQLKLEGRLSTSTLGLNAGNKTVTLVDRSIPLWEGSMGKCPEVLPYSFSFPATLLYEGQEHFTPPTHNLAYMMGSGMASKAKYWLKLDVTTKGRLGKRTKSVSIPVVYTPRSRPSLPICPTGDLFETIKVLPEEWFQALSYIEPREEIPGLEPISCALFVPDVRSYGLNDSIPFHVQLSGPLASLSSLLPDSKAERYRIRVAIERRVKITIHENDMVVRQSIGEGSVQPRPPAIDADSDSGTDHSHPVLNWEGSVRLREPAREPTTFAAANVVIQDFIVLTITPTYIRPPPFDAMKIAIPVRFVTDTWGDSFASEDQIGLI